MASRTKEQDRIYQLKRYHRLRREAIEKLGGRCVQCGAEENLHFDHIDPATKEFDVWALWGIAKKSRDTELDKCQLLCQPCHEKKHNDSIRADRTHATWGMYVNGKCRCAECKAFFNAYMKQYREKNGRRRKPSKNLSDHGDLNNYRRGCRCELCKATNAAYMREYHRRKNDQGAVL